MKQPDECKNCPEMDYDETPDGENMWAFCTHPDLERREQHSLETDDGSNSPPGFCPLSKSWLSGDVNVSTLEMLFGNNPPNEIIESEFFRRGLSLDDATWFDIVPHTHGRFMANGHYSTISDCPKIATMKLLIADDFLEKKKAIPRADS